MMVPAEETPRPRRGGGWIVLAVVIAVIIGVPLSIPLVNDAAARGVEARLRDLPLPDGAELVDSLSQAGKLSGNGNGMQYLGALLIRSDQSAAQIRSFYTTHAEGLSVNVAGAGDLAGLHGARGFIAEHRDPDSFVVYAWGDSPGALFDEFDLRGH